MRSHLEKRAFAPCKMIAIKRLHDVARIVAVKARKIAAIGCRRQMRDHVHHGPGAIPLLAQLVARFPHEKSFTEIRLPTNHIWGLGRTVSRGGVCAVASVMHPFKNVDDNLKFIITIYNSITVLQKGWLFMQETVVSEWLRRETKLLEEIASALEYYSRHTKRYQFWQRATSVSVMVLSTLAPLVVAGSGVAEGTFGLSRDNLSVAGVIITLILALIEGVRRIFRFEQRWATCYQVKSTIKREREGLPLSTHRIGRWQRRMETKSCCFTESF